ncbi:MAG TPA: pyridoxal-phosphate dependent enzyme [Capillimicrobium sp.]|nr:pyridoxal-phosphate dependent enzyme [Capillimicrobium sp.]
MSELAHLGVWRTPLEPADRLGAALGLAAGDLWIKRDDWLGLGGGGNKLRKLARLCAAAIDDGATMLVTSGAAQSNYARLTAAAARRLGLDVTLVLAHPIDDRATGNLALDGLLGARVVWTEGPPGALDATVAEVADAERARGGRPAVLPYGGSNALGAAGYLDCARELLEQAPDLRHAVAPVGSGGTMAGLVAGLSAERVLGVDAAAVPDPAERVAALAGELTGAAVAPAGLRLDRDQAGEGYERPTAASRRAMELAARHEALVLDPVYGAKAMAGLAAAVQRGEIAPGERTVFVATGGLPGLFGHPVAAELAAATRRQ